jgi:hypothetical protein
LDAVLHCLTRVLALLALLVLRSLLTLRRLHVWN